MFFFLGGWRTRHRARSAAMGCGGGEGKGGAWCLRFAREAFFSLFSFPGWWMRGREGGVGVVRDPLLRGGLSGLAWGRSAPSRGLLFFFPLLFAFLCFFAAQACPRTPIVSQAGGRRKPHVLAELPTPKPSRMVCSRQATLKNPPWKFLQLDLYHPSPPTCPIQRCPTTTQLQGSSRPAALKSQAAQPPAVTQGPGNHRLETWTVDQGGRSSLGEPRELPCQVCAVGQRCVSPICLFLCAVDTTCGRMVLALFAGPTKG